jgi:hypothetical protein
MGAIYFMKQLHTTAFNHYALTIHESGSISKETLGVRSRPNPLNKPKNDRFRPIAIVFRRKAKAWL